jgi:hypothetical protein
MTYGGCAAHRTVESLQGVDFGLPERSTSASLTSFKPTLSVAKLRSDAMGLEHERHVDDAHAHEADGTQWHPFVFLP